MHILSKETKPLGPNVFSKIADFKNVVKMYALFEMVIFHCMLGFQIEDDVPKVWVNQTRNPPTARCWWN